MHLPTLLFIVMLPVSAYCVPMQHRKATCVFSHVEGKCKGQGLVVVVVIVAVLAVGSRAPN